MGRPTAHLVRLGRVHCAVVVLVHQPVDAADGLEAQQSVLIPAEQLIYQAQVCNTAGGSEVSRTQPRLDFVLQTVSRI